MSIQKMIFAAMQQTRIAEAKWMIGYSIRKLSPAYEGYCLRVKRSSDNTTEDIGFVNGVVDLDSIYSFVGSGTGYVVIWYDQSGNGNDAELSTATAPYILSGRNFVYDTNGLPSIYFNSNRLLSKNASDIGTQITIFGVATAYQNEFSFSPNIVGGHENRFFQVGLNESGWLVKTMFGSGLEWNQSPPQYIESNSDKSWRDVQRVVTSINSEKNLLFIDGVYESGFDDIMGDFNDQIRVGGSYYINGAWVNYHWWHGLISEIIIYKPAVLALRSSIERDILNFYKPETVQTGDTSDAFIAITGITDTTIQNAIKTLVADLIDAEIWDKMIAIYPIVGGTADTHKYNLKDPRDADDAFRLSFHGGITHSSTGMLPNGSTGYAETHIIPRDCMLPTSLHLSYYSRTNVGNKQHRDMGSYSAGAQTCLIVSYVDGNHYSQISGNIVFANAVTQGLFLASKTQTGKGSVYINSTQKANEVTSVDGLTTHQMYLMATNNSGTLYEPCTKECAFASIGYGLTKDESDTFYDIINTFQTSLNRKVYSNIDTSDAFFAITGITDETIQGAITTLISDLQTAGVWSKMIAIYPFVGGTADTHKYNLKDPRDTDTAFRLRFIGGFTHSANGALGNGSTGYAETGIFPDIHLSSSNQHLSYYSRTNNSTASKGEMGVYDLNSQSAINVKYNNLFYANIGQSSISVRNLNSSGYFIVSKYNTGKVSGHRNGTKLINEATSADVNPKKEIVLFAWNNNGTIQRFTDRECAFASIGSGLNDTEAGNLNTAVQAFQTTLGRNV